MNTLRITKGSDIKLYADAVQLFFVTDFCAQQSVTEYAVREFLNSDDVDNIILNSKYTITITAYSHLNQSVFENQGFVLKVYDNGTVYEYAPCRLSQCTRRVDPNKPVIVTYTIIADDMKMTQEGLDE